MLLDALKTYHLQCEAFVGDISLNVKNDRDSESYIIKIWCEN